MPESEDEDYAYYGVPLEPLDEENVPRKKPFTIQEQIATDKQGRRRFHGAFTGGFSAGFFNTVGTLEGWKPSDFKSSREKKAERLSQRPEDFMDEEDTEEFGIAPTLLRAKPEYSGSTHSQAAKRKLEASSGPIPGVPVLKNMLEPTNLTIGVKLLMKLGWKPGQGVGPMLTWVEKMGNDIDPQELGLDPNVLFPPDPIQEHFVNAKFDRFGIGYFGLNKEPVLMQRFNLFDEPLKVNENKKKLSIRGQAFGVGAFEVEDDDIYAKDDMSHYDFALETSASLKEAKRKERQREKELLAITEKYDCIDGYQPAKTKHYRKKHFRPPEIPLEFDLNAPQKKSRFGPQVITNIDPIKGKHILNASDRAAILGESFLNQLKKDMPVDGDVIEIDQSNEKDTSMSEGVEFKLFVTDPLKQRRYERYLGFIKIGAKDALKSIQPAVMSDWEREREANEFEQAAKLYRPLSGIMGDRFSRGGLLDDSANPLAKVSNSEATTADPWVNAAKEKKFGKLTRSTSDWLPVSLLCKRMNIPEPNNGEITLAKVAEAEKQRKPKFSVFDFLDTSKDINLKQSFVEPLNNDLIKETNSETQSMHEKETENSTSVLSEPNYEKVINFEDPLEKMDLFKAIFASDDDDSGDEKEGKTNSEPIKTHPVGNINVLRNTSPPRGIFANLDLDALKPKNLFPKDALTTTEKHDDNKPQTDRIYQDVQRDDVPPPELMYGPILPTKPVFMHKKSGPNENTSSSSEEEWVEKNSKHSSKKKQKTKKHKKEKKKDKHKLKKKKRK